MSVVTNAAAVEVEERLAVAPPEPEILTPPAPLSMDEMVTDYAVGYQSVDTDCETEGYLSVEQGAIPAALEGTLLRNGPAVFERDGFKKEYLDGDGMVVSIAIKDGRAYFRNRFVQTETFKTEQEAGKFMNLSIFTADDPRPAITGKPMWQIRLFEDIFGGPPSPKNNGAYNAWYWGGSLVAVDFGMPHGLDERTLDSVPPYSTFSESAFTAHSRVVTDPNGSQVMCNFLPHVDWAAQKTTVTFMEFDEAGAKLRESVFSFGAAYFHDMVVTDHWYILFDCPIKMDAFRTFVGYPMGLNSLGDTIVDDPSRAPVFRLFPRSGDGPMLEVTAQGEHCFAYHHVNGFDVTEDGSQVVFDTCTWDNFNLYFKDIVEPDGVDFYPRTVLSRFVLDVNSGQATRHTILDRPCEYPTVAPAVTGQSFQHSYMCASAVHQDGVNGPMQAVCKVSMRDPDWLGGYPAGGVVADAETWLPGPRKYAGEPLFVARPDGTGAEDDGWLLMLVHDSEHVATELTILDAQRVSDGPVATLRLPVYVPMGVHGSWTPHHILGELDAMTD